jgi:5-methylcytosine-specific restriction protein A
MSRREFSKEVRRQALKRAAGNCEGTREGGLRCDGVLENGRYHFDHDIPDGLGGEPELWNCKVLCLVCHKIKTTTIDVPKIAKAKRNEDKHKGIRKASTFGRRPKQERRSQNSTRKPNKWVGITKFDTPPDPARTPTP